MKKNENNLTLGSLFDGIGAFPLAGINNGITPLWAAEIEKVPIEITKFHFPEMIHLGDVTVLKGEDLLPVDIVTAGTPCQDISVGNSERLGLNGSRSGLFFEMIRIIKEMRWFSEQQGNKGKDIKPRYLCWENVAGVFNSNKGEDFRKILEEIVSIGEKTSVSIPRPECNKDKWTKSGIILGDDWSIAYRQLDAQFFRVPQRRKRVFLVADFGGGNAAEILFECESLCRDN